jgi:ADP-ribose pyrophosphatase YjhB (NUDIX family)
MNYIISLTDKDIFPMKEIAQVSDWSKRKTVKILIQNKDGKIAMVTNPIHNFFLLPGGGIDGDEDMFTSADRESREEALCSIINPVEFGVTEEWRARDKKHYETFGVFAHEGVADTADTRTEDEKKNNLTVAWFFPDEVEEKLANQKELLKDGKVEFYNVGFNIVRDYVLFKTAREKKLF